MSSIDQRIVQMKFDNAQFESGIKTSTSSLDKLKESLKLDNAGAGLSNLAKMGQNFSLAGIAASVDTLTSKFDTLGIIAITTLQRITNAAITTGVNLVKSLTIDPISEGFADYNRKLTSVQTIMNATGESIKVVEGYFNQLDTYADKTIYNLDDMTGAFAKFTNAGVAMDKSVPAIKGVANMVALAGQDANAASIAMYNLSQSIAGGYLTTTDYRSLNLANVATKEWKQHMIDAAVAAGTLKKNNKGLYIIPGVKQAVNEAALFNEQLSTGWASTNVLLKVLGDYGDETTAIGKKAQAAAQDVKSFGMMMETLKAATGTGWTDTFQIVVGNLEEAKALFTPLTNYIGAFLSSTADARNNMLQVWKDNGGRDAMIQAITNAFQALLSVIKPIRDAFREVFPAMTGQRLAEITKGLRDLTSWFKIGDSTGALLHRTFAGIFAVIDIGKRALFAVVEGFGLLLKNIIPAGGGIFWITAQMGDWLVKLDEVIKKGDIFDKVVTAIGTAIAFVAVNVKDGILAIVNWLGNLGNFNLGSIDAMASGFQKSFEPVTKTVDGAKNAFEGFANFFKGFISFFKIVGAAVGTALGATVDGVSSFLSGIDADKVSKVIEGGLLAALLTGIWKFMKSLRTIFDGVAGVLEGVSGVLDGVQGSLKAWQQQLKAGALLKIAIALGILAAALYVLSTINGDKLATSLTSMGVMFGELMGTMAILQKIDFKSSLADMFKMTVGMIGMSIAIGMLADSMTELATLDWAGVFKGLASIGVLMVMLVQANKALGDSEGDVAKKGLGFILFATAINVLIKAVKQLGEMDIGTLIQGLVSVGVLLTGLALFLKKTNIDGMSLTKGAGILLLALAMSTLASAVKKFGGMDIPTLIQGLLSVAAILTVLSKFISSTGDAKNVISTAVGIAILGGALYILAGSIVKMADIPLGQFIKGLLTMGAALTTVALTMELMPDNMLSSSVALLGISVALSILAYALQNMGKMSLAEIAKSLIVLAVSLGIISAAMSSMTASLAGSAALIVMVLALTLLIPVLLALGSMSLAGIGKSLLALAGIFVILGLAAVVLAPLAPALITLAIAIGLLGVAAMAAGLGVSLFGAGLAALAATGAAGIAVFVLAIKGILDLLPFMMTSLANAIVAFSTVIGQNAPVLATAFMSVLQSIIQTINVMTPQIIQCLVNMIVALVNSLVSAIPQLYDAGYRLIIGLLQAFADNIQGIINAGANVIMKFIDGVASALPRIVDAAFRAVVTLINGLADAIRGNHQAIYNAVANLIDAISDAVMDLGPTLAGVGENIIRGFIKGFSNMGRVLADAAKGVVGDAVSGVKKFLGIHSPSRVFAEIGKYSALGLAGGLSSFADVVSTEAMNVGSTAVDALTSAIANVYDVIDSDVNINPTIRPVLDLSNIASGSSAINTMLNKNQGITASSTSKLTSAISSSMKTNPDQVQNGGILQTQSTEGAVSKPAILQLVLSNGKAIAEFILDDLDTLSGAKNKITGRMAGI